MYMMYAYMYICIYNALISSLMTFWESSNNMCLPEPELRKKCRGNTLSRRAFTTARPDSILT